MMPSEDTSSGEVSEDRKSNNDGSSSPPINENNNNASLLNRKTTTREPRRDSAHVRIPQDNSEEDLESLHMILPEDTRLNVESTNSCPEEIQEREYTTEQSLHEILPEDSNIHHEAHDTEKAKVQANTAKKPTITTSVYNEIKLLAVLSFFAIIGVLARKGITVLTTYNGAYVGGVIWANFTSCIIMGMLIQSERAWLDHGPKASIALYIGLTTGFCGTFSSFSSLVLEAFIKSADISIGKYYHYPNGAYGIMECASVIIAHMSVSIAGLHFGKHMIKQYDPKLPYLRAVENIIALSGILAWIAVICLIAIKSWRSWIFACIVSPIACWTRYYVSKLLNPKVRRFPMGTFAVNVFATLIMAILNLLNRGKLPRGAGRITNTVLSCHMIQGLEDGYCGTLSTVSTFVVELYTIKSPQSYRYGFISLAVSFIIMLLVLGSYNWAVGLTDPLCS